jgi:hypothetical protein
MALVLTIMAYCLAKIVPLNSPFLYSVTPFQAPKATELKNSRQDYYFYPL